MNHNFVFTISLKKKILIAILVVFCKKKSENYSIFVKNNCQFSLCFLFLLPSQKKRRQGISEEIDGD